MLSILIPEHNYDCSKLVNDLACQCNQAKISFEIIVWDDASSLYKKENQTINSINGCHLMESNTNLGSARVRNKLAEMARYPNLVMIDCDAEVTDANFIKNYLENIGKAQVVVGGVQYSSIKPSPNRYLRWYYGRKRECPVASVRNQNPYRSLLSFNLMIDKSVLMQYPYDEHFKDYGHEDSMMGYNLMKQGITVLHIDNQLIHKGLDLNIAFLSKSLKAVEKYVHNPAFQSEDLVDQIKIFKVFRMVKRFGLCRLLAFKYTFGKRIMVYNLCSKHPILFLYDFYRISYLCHYSLKRKTN